MKANSVINIVSPMAGEGSRFSSAGYKTPKPFLPIHGLEMISAVIQNLRPAAEHRFILLTRRGHDEYLAKVVERASNDDSKIEIIFVDELTEGAACTVLLAREFIDNNDELMISFVMTEVLEIQSEMIRPYVLYVWLEADFLFEPFFPRELESLLLR